MQYYLLMIINSFLIIIFTFFTNHFLKLFEKFQLLMKFLKKKSLKIILLLKIVKFYICF